MDLELALLQVEVLFVDIHWVLALDLEVQVILLMVDHFELVLVDLLHAHLVVLEAETRMPMTSCIQSYEEEAAFPTLFFLAAANEEAA